MGLGTGSCAGGRGFGTPLDAVCMEFCYKLGAVDRKLISRKVLNNIVVCIAANSSADGDIGITFTALSEGKCRIVNTCNIITVIVQ